MRVVTEASLTRHAATQAVRPFGRSGSWTRYHAARQLPSTLRARTQNRVGNSFWLTMSNRARTGPPRQLAGRERLTRDGDDRTPLAAHALDGSGPAAAAGGARARGSRGRGRDHQPGQR